MLFGASGHTGVNIWRGLNFQVDFPKLIVQNHLLTTCPQWLEFDSCGTIFLRLPLVFVPLFDKITPICTQIRIKLSRVLYYIEGVKAKMKQPGWLQRYISAILRWERFASTLTHVREALRPQPALCCCQSSAGQMTDNSTMQVDPSMSPVAPSSLFFVRLVHSWLHYLDVSNIIFTCSKFILTQI